MPTGCTGRNSRTWNDPRRALEWRVRAVLQGRPRRPVGAVPHAVLLCGDLRFDTRGGQAHAWTIRRRMAASCRPVARFPQRRTRAEHRRIRHGAGLLGIRKAMIAWSRDPAAALPEIGLSPGDEAVFDRSVVRVVRVVKEFRKGEGALPCCAHREGDQPDRVNSRESPSRSLGSRHRAARRRIRPPRPARRCRPRAPAATT